MVLKTEKCTNCPRCGKILSPFRIWQIHGNNWRFVCYGNHFWDAMFRCGWVSGIVGEDYHPKDAVKVNLDGSIEFRKKMTKGELQHGRCAQRNSDRQV